MRRFALLAVVILTSSAAYADDAGVPSRPEPKLEAARTKVPLRVVRVMPESHQALLYDKTRGTHVLAEIGGTVDGYKVEDIDADEVTLSLNGAPVVLAAPDRSWRRRGDVHTAKPELGKLDASPLDPAGSLGTRAPADPYAVAELAPVDPYGAASIPADPYAAPAVRTVEAPRPLEAGDGGVRTAEAPGSEDPVTAAMAAAITTGTVTSSAATPRPADPIADAFADALIGTSTAGRATSVAATAVPATGTGIAIGTPSAVPATAVAATGTATAAATTAASTAVFATTTALPRHDVDLALGDFGKLTTSIRGSFTPAGAKLDAITDNSLFARAGLRAGDVITAVDGKPLRSLDDAADLYARASTTRSISIQLIRADKPITLRLTIQ